METTLEPMRLAQVDFEQSHAEDLLAWAFERFGERVALVSSFQAEAMVLIDMAARIEPAVRVITVDTGRLPQETYDLIERTRRRYGIRVEILFPDAADVQAMVGRHGPNLFYEAVSLRQLCCHVRKVLPLRRALAGLEAWVTGIRREQSPIRAAIQKIEVDSGNGGLLKICPLADWTEHDVWKYIRAHDVPYHSLYDQGYASISCAPCSRSVGPGQDSRAGRWWWEGDAPKECGLHGLIPVASVGSQPSEVRMQDSDL